MIPSNVNPSTLSNKRPYSPSASSSSSTLSEMTPRKRPRVSEGATSGEKKEARAARNRIAAQESRDRRKREFADLHQRVAQLEAENAALRENKPFVTGIEKTERLERENAELLERVTRLEAALTTVLPLIQGGATRAALPTPAPSPSPSSFQTLSPSTTEPSTETARHLARVATVPSPSLDVKVTPQQRVVSIPMRFSPRSPSSPTPTTLQELTIQIPSLKPPATPPRPTSFTLIPLSLPSMTCTPSTSRRSQLRNQRRTSRRWGAQNSGCVPPRKPAWRLIIRR
jgi:hypothetical protein